MVAGNAHDVFHDPHGLAARRSKQASDEIVIEIRSFRKSHGVLGLHLDPGSYQLFRLFDRVYARHLQHLTPLVLPGVFQCHEESAPIGPFQPDFTQVLKACRKVAVNLSKDLAANAAGFDNSGDRDEAVCVGGHAAIIGLKA